MRKSVHSPLSPVAAWTNDDIYAFSSDLSHVAGTHYYKFNLRVLLLKRWNGPYQHPPSHLWSQPDCKPAVRPQSIGTKPLGSLVVPFKNFDAIPIESSPFPSKLQRTGRARKEQNPQICF